MRNLFIFFIFFHFVPIAYSQSGEPTLKEITDKLQQRYEKINDAVIKFDKHVKLGFSSIEQDFNGTLYMRKPNKYRLEVEDQILVTDGITVWAYTSTNNQVIIDKYKENSNVISPEQFMLNLPQNYYVSIIGSQKSKGETIQLKLIPKDDRSFVKSVKLYIEKSNWMIRKIVILDMNETETTYVIQNMEINKDISLKTFTFELPSDAEVVDIRQLDNR